MISEKSLCTFLLTCLVSGGYAVSGGPIAIAVLDTPIDFDHPEIRAVLDEGLLKNVSFTDEHGKEKSWYELNQQAKAELERRIGHRMYTQEVEHLDALLNGDTQNRSFIQELRNRIAIKYGNLKYRFSAKYRTSFDLISFYRHGTHVAGIAMKSLTDTRLISFPIMPTVPSPLTIREILKFNPDASRMKLNRQFQQITQVLKANNVRIVNLSFNTSNSEAIGDLLKRASHFQKLVFQQDLPNIAVQESAIFTDELQKFVHDNPEAIFVMAAGNESRQIDETDGNSVAMRADNLIKVAAVDASGRLAFFSNRSPIYIDIAAPGVRVLSALAGGGESRHSGTSYAAPAVANAIARILEAAPQLSAKAAIEVLYSQRTTSDARLKNQVAQGRVLIPSFPEPDLTCDEVMLGQ